VTVPEGRPDPSALPSLRRVVVINQRVVTPSGRERLVTTVELWSDHAVVRWSESDLRSEHDPLRSRRALQDGGRDQMLRPVVALEDDVGNAYRVESGGGRGGSWPVDRDLHLEPEIAQSAAELRINWGDGSRTSVSLTPSE